MADPMRNRQIIANIVSNSVKYTVRGRIEVRVERRGDQIAIEVADTGPGLSGEELEQPRPWTARASPARRRSLDITDGMTCFQGCTEPSVRPS